MKKVGILGGTFDPPHIGHIMMAEEVLFAKNLDEIWFIPTNIPPHKSAAHSKSAERLDMLWLATKENKKFHVSPIEINKKEVSYTIHTIKALQAEYKDVRFYFIIGADMIEYLPNWYEIDELLTLIEFIGVDRVGYTSSTPYPVSHVSTPYLEISSSDIRQRINDGRPYDYFLHKEVAHYIKEYQLYGSRDD